MQPNGSGFKEEQLKGKAAEHNRVWLAGVPISALDLQESLSRLGQMVSDGNYHYICFLEANLLSHVNRNRELRNVLCSSSMVLPDGVALTLLARILGIHLPERVPGPRFLPAACDYGLSRGYTHFFYGGKPGVAERLAVVLSQRYPGLRVAGTYSPPFRPLAEDEEHEVKATIEAARPHLLWVGLGGPKQEFWMAEHLGKINVPVMLGVGAAFDFHTGHAPWAPPVIRKMGLEWAYRAVTGGRRVFLRNLRCVSVSALVMVQEVWSGRVRGERQHGLIRSSGAASVSVAD